MGITKTQFKNLMDLDVREDVSQNYKGLNYLSWAAAYQLMMEHDPEATYNVLKAPDNLPYFTRGDVHMVFTEVTMYGVTKEMWLPIMDNKNNSVKTPNSRDVSDNVMRCLVKNIAMFGIGLRLYKKDSLDDLQADEALLRVIGNLMKSLELSKETVEDMTVSRYGKDDIRMLSKDQATDLIHQLKDVRRQKERGQLSTQTAGQMTQETPVTSIEPKVTAPKKETPEKKVVTELPPVTPVQDTPTVEVQVEQPVPQPATQGTDGLTADQYKRITALYKEKKMTKEQLKEEVVAVAPGTKGIKELTVEQADAVIERIESRNAA